MTATDTKKTATRGPSRRQRRSLQRAVHLITGLALLVQLYAASLLGPGFTAMVRWILVPIVVATGIAMWQGPRIRRLFRDSGPHRA